MSKPIIAAMFDELAHVLSVGAVESAHPDLRLLLGIRARQLREEAKAEEAKTTLAPDLASRCAAAAFGLREIVASRAVEPRESDRLRDAIDILTEAAKAPEVRAPETRPSPALYSRTTTAPGFARNKRAEAVIDAAKDAIGNGQCIRYGGCVHYPPSWVVDDDKKRRFVEALDAYEKTGGGA